MKEVLLAKSAGFCYGVQRAVRLAEEAAADCGPCVMLGSIIHNAHVVEDLARHGVRRVNAPEELHGGETVIIRSHGESRAILEQLAEKRAHIINSTCPRVLKIQQLVQEAEREGRRPLIIGEPNHPEVLGVAGWCAHPLIFQDAEAIRAWLQAAPEHAEMPLTVVSQTTCTQKLFEICTEILKKECTNVKIFDTICDATYKRQSEAAEIAARADAMIVVGDRQSANTRHLTEICTGLCPVVFQIEWADELPLDDLKSCDVVGLTAGASTPSRIIKEVYRTMSEETIVTGGAEDFEKMLEESFKTLNTGDKVTGVVTAITPTEIQVDLGTKQAGYIPLSELSDDPSVKAEDVVKVGDEIETYVVRVNDVEGYATLSKKRLDTVKMWESIETAKEEKTTLEGVVTEENKGGIVVSVKGIRVFVPASQSGMPRNSDLSEMIKQKVQLRITEVNRARRRVVGSIRAVQYEARQAAAEAIWADIEEGKKYTGTVKSLTSYGAFVDIGGVDGMVHISELSWSRIKHPSEVVSVGDQVEVYVISFDKEKRKISLGLKDRSVDPWDKFVSTYHVGDVASVKVVKLMTFGAFAEVVPGVDGLIHISQIADRRIEKPSDVLSEGQVVDAKIIAIDEENKKISLSIRALLQEEPEETEEEAEEAPVEE
ncbi:MAG TPA: bifunctional 4-hydroxy-3-methylbut-2-enyl diphosphate reductase/30S ribosomal protein S1 [Firmicutes bacterium]|nr:bifunctional 4-hydroxy-3-methylbut-2-enyl diphosphate reductase/30S ribosomal protein S1 [Bacillota bacterium]